MKKTGADQTAFPVPCEERLRKIAIIKAEVERELDRGLEYAEHEMDHLHKGLIGSVVINPFVKLVYLFAGKDQIRARGLKQVEVMMACAAESEGNTLDEVLKEHFDDYLFYDETYMRSRKLHPKFPELKELIWKTFNSRMEFIIKILDGNGDSYDGLVRSVFTKEEAEMEMGKDFEFVDEMMALVEREKGLLDIPALARKEVIDMLHISYKYARRRMKERIEQIYRDG